MATPKRASMREGPLAALFRKTSEDLPEEEKRESRKATGGRVRPAPEGPQAIRARSRT